MNHRKLAVIALIMAVVFGFIVFVYPLLFNPDAGPAQRSEVAEPPAATSP